jgi:F-type H+-transporting ATPase subunit gamma
MANLKEIRSRITSVNSTRQITSAMKMVSAAKLRRAQDAVVQMRPYALKLKEILTNVSATLDSTDGIYSAQREVKNTLIIAVNSNRGLCGGFNNNIIKAANILIKQEASAKVKVFSIGKKAYDLYKKTTHHPDDSYPETPYTVYESLTFLKVSAFAEVIMEKFKNGDIDKVILIYNSFKNAASQIVVEEQYLPVLPPAFDGGKKASSVDYLYEPNKEEIIKDLIPKSLKTQLYKAVLDSNASEHGARMTAMHKATDNASDLLKELKLTYNKARQASITNEILEIVGGAEALKG